MALLYPNLMAVPGNACHPTWRTAGMGIYRMWRDAGYGVGAIVIDLVMQGIYPEAAFYHGRADVRLRRGRLPVDGRDPSRLRYAHPTCAVFTQGRSAADD
jgi:hypothetical protein